MMAIEPAIAGTAPALSAPVVAGTDLWKVFDVGAARVEALRGVDVAIRPGEFVALTGPSGSGKSTLLHVLGLVTRPTSGHVLIGGRDTASLSDGALSALRLKTIGFIFQTFNLLPVLTAEQNVGVVLQLAGVGRKERRERARDLLRAVGLGERLNHKPAQLSGGERQRVAIARALANGPQVLLADEPTGNLDTATGDGIVGILESLHAHGQTLLLVTHNQEIAARAQRQLVLRDGRLVEW
jgi:putative ABC transport system ATP-binding protein